MSRSNNRSMPMYDRGTIHYPEYQNHESAFVYGSMGKDAQVSPGWYHLINDHEAFSARAFNLDGYVTFKVESRKGAQFWYAYQKIEGKTKKLYAGKRGDLTPKKVSEITYKFHSMKRKAHDEWRKQAFGK